MNQLSRPLPTTSLRRALIAGIIAGTVILTLGTLGISSAGTLGTISAGTLHNSATSLLPTAGVRDLFPEAANTEINALVADYNDGGGFVVNAGPTWTTSETNWRVEPSGSARHASGTAKVAALFPFMTRDVSAAVRLTGATSTTDAGPMLYSSDDPATPNGVFARLYSIGATTATFVIWNQGTDAACGSSSTTITYTSGITTFDLTLAYDRVTTTLTATVKPLGVGETTTTRTCTYTPTADRASAGLMSYATSTASYTDLLFSYE